MNQRVNTESLGQSLSYQFGGLAFAVDDVIPDEIKGLINGTQKLSCNWRKDFVRLTKSNVFTDFTR